MEKIRLQKFLSSAGVCSRRGAEVLISQGRIKINGKVAKLGDKVNPDQDEVTLNNKLIKPAEEFIYLLLNKPAGYTCTRANFRNEKNIYSLLPPKFKKIVWPVGRLDKDSCGLLLLTNDGELTQKLTHPKFQHEKEYLVKYRGELTPQKINQLRSGISLEGKKTSPCKISVVKPGEVKIILKEGQKRQVRRMLEAVDCQTAFLQRIRENKLTLGSLKIGEFKHASLQDII